MRRSNASAELRWPAGPSGDDGERGSASLEFLTVGMLLLVPLVYLVLAIAAVQGGALAVEGAARQAARVAVEAGGRGDAEIAVERAVAVALADYGIEAGEASVELDCQAGDCAAPGSRVRVSVRATVRLPLVPDVLDLDRVGSVPLDASATQTVSRFAGDRP
ncbi:hypothetical protein PX701_05630 [Agromyces sp. H3Y2-19a]|jgi:hypothetical protein|uniref:hypothetical protein n=1 Tax=Agromyces TaxID=33877 RepID=UPI001E4C9CF0|nr:MULTISPECIES: hypothetical protein [Agromyces]MCD5346738.1 hypothetical protein [Agromyces sp. S2-1-8]MDF0513097.1 hypothetical protein [Agromyces chromiiresistens]